VVACLVPDSTPMMQKIFFGSLGIPLPWRWPRECNTRSIPENDNKTPCVTTESRRRSASTPCEAIGKVANFQHSRRASVACKRSCKIPASVLRCRDEREIKRDLRQGR
jgi:hypothetical protein